MTMMPLALEDLARQAIGGDRDALDRLVRALQGDVYGLALRMLWNREDAEDATQEILVRTHLVIRSRPENIADDSGGRSALPGAVDRLGPNWHQIALRDPT